MNKILQFFTCFLAGNPYNNPMEKVILGDCLNILPTIPDKSIDLILADLPFGTTKCHWDSIILIEKEEEYYNLILKRLAATKI